MLNIEDLVSDYTKETEKLFKKWRTGDLHQNELFIEDGVVNPNIYYACEDRILFLLKEAYSDDEEFCLTEYLADKGKGIPAMWRRVTEWTKLIVEALNGNIGKALFKRNGEFERLGNEYLQRIAVVNIKKSGGKSNSGNDDLQKYVDKDAEELLAQLKICDPTIIVCGNVEQYLRQILKLDKKELEFGEYVEREHFIYHFELNGHDVKVISYWHPSNYYPNLMNYYGFEGICRIAFGKK